MLENEFKWQSYTFVSKNILLICLSYYKISSNNVTKEDIIFIQDVF